MSRLTATPQGSMLPPPQESLFEFRKNLLSILSKFSDNHTMKTGMDEIRKFMTADITDNDRMNCFLSAISDQNEHMKPQQKKEQIKIYGLAAEIFEESLIPFIPKILATLQKKIKENTVQIHEAVSDALGQLVFFIINKVDDFTEKQELLENFFKLPMQLLEKSPNKTVQAGAAQCLSKVVQNSPEDVLSELLDDLTDKMILIMNQNSFKAHTPLLECIISLVFHVEQDFTPYASKFLPVLIEFIACNDWSTKKVAIDAIYSMTAIIKEEIIPFRLDILQVLNHCRFDKIKPVREATLETIKLIKEIGPPLDEEQLALIEDKPVKNAKQGPTVPSAKERGNGSKSARPTKNGGAEEQNFSNIQPINKQNTTAQTKKPPAKDGKKVPLKDIQKSNTSMLVSKDEEQDVVSNVPNKNDKKVSSATLKRRAAQSPLREQTPNMTGSNNLDGDKSPVRKEFISVFKQMKNANFFKDQSEIEIFEGKRPDNFDEMLAQQPIIEEVKNKKDQISSSAQNSDNEAQFQTTLTKQRAQKTDKINANAKREEKEQSISNDQKNKDKNKKQPRPKFQKPQVQKKNDAFDNIMIYEPKQTGAPSQKIQSEEQQIEENFIQSNKVSEQKHKFLDQPEEKHKHKSWKAPQEQESFQEKQQNIFSPVKSVRNEQRAQQNENQDDLTEDDNKSINSDYFQHGNNMSFNAQQNKQKEENFLNNYQKYKDDYDDVKPNENTPLRKSISLDNYAKYNQQNYQEINQNAFSLDKENNYSELGRSGHKKSSVDLGQMPYSQPQQNNLNLQQQNNSGNPSGIQQYADSYQYDYSQRLSVDQNNNTPNLQGYQQVQNTPQKTLHNRNYTPSALLFSQQSNLMSMGNDYQNTQQLPKKSSIYDIQPTATTAQSLNLLQQSQNLYTSPLTTSITSLNPQNNSASTNNLVSSYQKLDSFQYSNLSQNVQLVMHQMEKMNQQQSLFMETVKNFQDNVKIEMAQIKTKVTELETQILELKVQCNNKINGDEVRDLINKKFNQLTEFKKEADNLQMKTNQYAQNLQSLRGTPIPMQNNFILPQPLNLYGQSLPSLDVQSQLLSPPYQEINHHDDYQFSNPGFANNNIGVSDFNQNQDEKKNVWKYIQGMVQRQQFNDAFLLALNAEDEMILIRLLSKTGSFEFEKLYEPQRDELIKRSLMLLEGKEFIDILIPCISEAVDRFYMLMSRSMKELIIHKLSNMKYDRDFSEIQKLEIKRVTDKLSQVL